MGANKQFNLLEFYREKAELELQFRGDTILVVNTQRSFASQFPYGYYCGYVYTTTNIVLNRDAVSIIPVHGGVTFMEKVDGGGMLYGFDCAHNGDNLNINTRDLNWLRNQALVLSIGLEVLSRYEDVNYWNHVAEIREEIDSILNRFIIREIINKTETPST